MSIRKSTGYGTAMLVILAMPLGWPMNTPIWHGVVTLMAVIFVAGVAAHFRRLEASPANVRPLGLMDLGAIMAILAGLFCLLPTLWNTSSRF